METENPVKLTQRHVAVGEVAQQALAVASAGRAGVVDGVEVDFRHPGIPSGEWEARAWWYVGDAGSDHCGFLLPSEANACREANGKDDLVTEKLALPKASPGDRLTVEGVVDEISDRRFDHLHDATVKLAQLVLTRPDGTELRPASPLAFYGVTQLRVAPERDAYDRLSERIRRDHGPTNRLEQPADHFALDHGPRAAIAMASAEPAVARLLTEHLKNNPQGLAALRLALNQTALAAFFQAKHELRLADKLGSATAANLALGPKSQLDQAAIDFAKEAWRAAPGRRRKNIAKELAEKRGAAGDDNVIRAIMRTLEPHDPHRRG